MVAYGFNVYALNALRIAYPAPLESLLYNMNAQSDVDTAVTFANVKNLFIWLMWGILISILGFIVEIFIYQSERIMSIVTKLKSICGWLAKLSERIKAKFAKLQIIK